MGALLAGQAFAASQMQFSLEVKGDNKAAEWKMGNLPRPLYDRTNATAADGESIFIDATTPVNYAVVLKASGVHSGGPSNNYTIFGAANVVFNLELYAGGAGSTSLATGAVFKSTINNGANGDPQAAAAFAVSYQIGGQNGRLIDNLLAGGPRMEPIFTYPFFAPNSGKLIGMGAGYKEWNHSTLEVFTKPGVGMGPAASDNPMPNGVGGFTDGLGVVPIAEGQIDMSALPLGTYTLKVVPGLGNNVLRGDLNMLSSENRPAFATAVNSTVGDTITFVTTNAPPCNGIRGRHVFYNNSAWDGNNPAVNPPADYAAIAPDKSPLLPGGGTATFANYISYKRGINGIIVDACHFNRAPILGQDLFFLMGNTTSEPPEYWTDEAPAPTNIVLRPGEGAGGSDRLIITWADNAIPKSKWLLTAILADDPGLGLPATDMFCFGLAIGEVEGNFIVGPSDELGIRSHPRSALNPAPIDFQWDIDRDKRVGPPDELTARSNRTTALNQLKAISW